MSTITFVLPGYSRVPIGGYKMVFEYANYLVKRNKVNILFLNEKALNKYPIPNGIKRNVINYFTQKEPKWFNLNKNIKKISGRNRNINKVLLESDAVIATAATTVKYVNDNFKNSKKFYFIQDFENWEMNLDELYSTYKMNFTNIVVSHWLADIVKKHSNTIPIYIQNPIDVSKYKIITPIEQRNKFILGMLYHVRPTKGTKYTLAALREVKKEFPQLQVKMFGATKAPANLPEWIEYYENASQEETIKIYNSISTFVNGTIEEGFGLTGLEGMACGAALVSTDYLGVREYAINGVDALLSPVKDINGLKNNIEKILKDDDLRIKLAKAGNVKAQNFSLSKACKKFEKVILGEK